MKTTMGNLNHQGHEMCLFGSRRFMVFYAWPKFSTNRALKAGVSHDRNNIHGFDGGLLTLHN